MEMLKNPRFWLRLSLAMLALSFFGRNARAQAAASPASTNPTIVSGLLQLQLTGGDSLLRATYRIRRAELKVVTDLGRGAQAVVMIDGAKALAITSVAQPSVSQSTRMLQDAYIVFPIARIKVDAGQQRLPLGFEGAHSSSGLETIDRALFQSDRARGGALSDVRDIGAAARVTSRGVELKAGLFNGTGESMNDTDRNVGKAAVGQLVFRPKLVSGLRLGVSGATSGSATGDKPVRDRAGADFVFVRKRASFIAEFMAGQDGLLQRRGGYVLATLTPVTALKFVGRFDAFDPNIRAEATPADVTERDYVAGVTWAPAGTRLKLHTAVVRKTFTARISPSTTQLLTQLQAAW